MKQTMIALLMAGLVAGCASSNSSGGQKSSGKSGDSAAAGQVVGGVLGAVASGKEAQGGSEGNKAGAALDVFNAATLSEDDVKNLTKQYVRYSDSTNRIAPPGNKYAKRLAKLTSRHQREDGLKLNYKVYLSPNVNAFATADGSIRVYSGLMDLMTDDELRSVIGHEIGHVKHKHSANAIRTAYLASAGRKALAANSGVAGRLAESELGALGEAILNSGFSRSQETESDDYGFEFMKKYKYNAAAMETAFRKLAGLSGRSGGMSQVLSTHPDPGARADRVKAKLGTK
ncbi:M48 family metallopeptidase [Chitinimonas lacunae]|uniref:M48 family metalloprotease n=1 Tax=Chitinimonas lacunae TaxID=1963018 RepID=A0ABV8ML40_9NEIS